LQLRCINVTRQVRRFSIHLSTLFVRFTSHIPKEFSNANIMLTNQAVKGEPGTTMELTTIPTS
jgi:hypothetical protein